MDLEDSLLTEREEVEVLTLRLLLVVLLLTLRLLLVVATLRLLVVLLLTLRLLLVVDTLRLLLVLLFAVVDTLRLFAVFDATLTLRLPLGSAGPTERPARFLSHPPLTLRLGV